MPKVSFFSEDLSNLLQAAGRTELTNLNSTLCKSQSLKRLLLDCTLGELQFCINFHSFNLTSFTLCFHSRASFASWLGKGSLPLSPLQPQAVGWCQGKLQEVRRVGYFPDPQLGMVALPMRSRAWLGSLDILETRSTASGTTLESCFKALMFRHQKPRGFFFVLFRKPKNWAFFP